VKDDQIVGLDVGLEAAAAADADDRADAKRGEFTPDVPRGCRPADCRR
jgi:hypothetical protein